LHLGSQEARATLFYSKDGREIEIRRIYNRVIVDELMSKDIKYDFDFREELDVEWAGHPNWFFRLSKFSLPFLQHRAVPRAWFLSDLTEYPADLDRFVLKPLFFVRRERRQGGDHTRGPRCCS
jgi:hypothetical protein